MWWLLSTMCLVHVCGNIFCLFETTMNPEVHMNVSEIIIRWGYASEEYEAVTDDGYILPINRIPHGKNNTNSTGPKKVVLCQHGLFATPGVWVSNPPNNSLAFILADAGYDVWMGNSRGSTWAKKHLYLDPNSKEFWAFSYDEMIKYDIPATINFILKKTGQKQIYYVGHNQGTLIALGAFSTNQQLAEKIKMCFLLAPVATAKYDEDFPHLLSYICPTSLKLIFGEKELLPMAVFNKQSGYTCNVIVTDTTCFAIKVLITGYVSQHLNKSRTDVYITHSLARTSVQNLLHYSQAVNTGVFGAYDWGSPSLNMLHYNQTTPPLYNLEDMKVPTAMWSGRNDFLADDIDVAHLSRIDMYAGQIRAGTSVRSILHFSQGIRTGLVQAYNWGSEALNMQHYNQSTPPIYNLENMKVQTVIWSGVKDTLANPTDVKNLAAKTNNVVYHEKIDNYNHVDFIIGKDITVKVYKK